MKIFLECFLEFWVRWINLQSDFLSSHIQTQSDAYEPTVHEHRWAQKSVKSLSTTLLHRRRSADNTPINLQLVNPHVCVTHASQCTHYICSKKHMLRAISIIICSACDRFRLCTVCGCACVRMHSNKKNLKHPVKPWSTELFSFSCVSCIGLKP